jgi:acyl carrier protein phosphodiesterase
LSFDHEEILVGNLISDFVKGKTKFNYTEGIQGDPLHRAIDSLSMTTKPLNLQGSFQTGLSLI